MLAACTALRRHGVRVVVPRRRRRLRPEGAPVRRGGDPAVPVPARGCAGQVVSRTGTRPRGERPLEGGRLHARAGARRARARSSGCAGGSSATAAPTGPSVDEPDRPALRRVDAPGIYSIGAVRYEVDAAVDEQVPEHGVPRASAGRRDTRPREALIDDAARTLGIDPWSCDSGTPAGRPASVSATGCSYDGGSYAESIRRARSCRLRRLRERQRRAPRAGPLPRDRLQPVRRAGRVGRRDRGRQGLPGLQYLDAVCVRDGARRHR